MSSLDPRTAPSNRSIWRDLSEDTFRGHLVTLAERTNAVPVPPQLFSVQAQCSPLQDDPHILPVEVEQRIADDIAYLAAVSEGAQSVSAVCLEETHKPPSLCIRLAAVDVVDEQVRSTFVEVGNILKQACALSICDRGTAEVEQLLSLIVRQHYQKLLGRLRSSKWQKPKYLSRTHKKALWQDFDNLIHRVQFIYTKRKDPRKPKVMERLTYLANVLHGFEDDLSEPDAELTYLIHVVRECYIFCTSPEVRHYAAKVEALPNATAQIAAAVKALRQLEKIGAYQRIAQDLIATASRYPTLFRNIKIEYIRMFSAVPTNIGFEDWASTAHVHAEVQLAVYYDMSQILDEKAEQGGPPSHLMPRVIGTSKYLCYLCFLFLKHHSCFVLSNTHGRLYDQWTIPDLAEFDEDIQQRYRKIVQNIDAEVVAMSDEIGPKEGKRDSWRVEPMTSRQNLLTASDGRS